MERLLEIGLSNAVMAAALAVVAGLVGLLCRRPALVHVLWLLVLLKLVTPPLLSISIRPPARSAAEESLVSLSEPSSPEAETGMDPEAAPAGGEEDNALEAEDEQAGPIPAEEGLSASPAEALLIPAPSLSGWAQHGTRLLAGAWLIGSLAWFGLAAHRLWRFARALRHARPASPALVERVSALARRVGLGRRPRVLLVPGRITPMVWCAGPPVLLAPEGLEERVGGAGLDTLLLHELAHIRRRDHWVRWLEFAVLGLFWWNPVAWYARRELHEAEEQCCDAWVVRTLPGAARTYATALVDALDFLCDARPAVPPMSCGLGQAADLKRRLTMILRGTTPHGLGRSNALAVLGLAVMLLPLVPLWGQAQPKAEEAPKRVVLGFVEQKKGPADELQQMQAEIEKKAKELADLKAKMAALKKQAAENPMPMGQWVGGGRLKRTTVKLADPMIRIEISGLTINSEDMQKLAETLKKMFPGKEKRVLFLAGREAEFRLVHPPHPAAPVDPAAPAALPAPPRPGMPGMAPRPLGIPPGDKRIDSVEKKLDLLLRELEALRKEIRRPVGGGGRGGFGGVPAKPGTPGAPGGAPVPPPPAGPGPGAVR